MSDRLAAGVPRTAAILSVVLLLSSAGFAQITRADSVRILGAQFLIPSEATLLDEATLTPPEDAISVSLDQSVRMALAQSPSVRRANLQAAIAASNVTLGNAGFLPSASAGLTLSGSDTQGLTGGGEPSADRRSINSLQADISAGWTIYDGLRRNSTLRRLRAEADRATLDADADAEDTAFFVAAAYLDLVRLERVTIALAEAAAISRERLQLAQARADIGVGANIDAALALADLNADRAALLRQQIAVSNARARLGQLIGLPEPDRIATVDALTLPEPLDTQRIAEIAEARNRRLQAFRAGEQAAAAAAGEVRADFRPQVRFQTGIGGALFGGGILPFPDVPIGPDFRYGITASLPLFDGFERQRRLRNAEFAIAIADENTRSERLALRTALAQLQITYARSLELVALETQNLEVVRRNVQVALSQFELGFISAIDLRQIQLALVTAEVSLAQTIFQTRLAATELRLLAGELLPPDAALVPPVSVDVP
ncbi:TolC family protein [soil metagenome]